MASSFRSLYDIPGHVPRMDVLIWGRCDFPISFSNRDTSRNAWNRHWGSFMIDTGSYQAIWSSPLTNVKWHSVIDHIQWQPPTDHTFYRTRPFTEFWEVSIEHMRRVWHADRGRYSSGHLVPSLWDLHMFYLMRPILFPNSSLIFPDYALRISLRTFSILPFNLKS